MRFRSTLMNGRWHLMLPEYRAFRWLAGDHEKERLASMCLNIGDGDCVVDVGAEDGDMTCLLSTFASHGSMVVVEPSRRSWPIIKATFEANSRPEPTTSFVGFASSRTEYAVGCAGWPDVALAPPEPYDHDMSYLSNVPQLAYDMTTKLDDLVGKAGVITIDVEGSELLALRGAEQILIEHRPLVWVSIHPNLLKHRYSTQPREVLAFMERLDYRAVHLADDHESHWMFEPM